MIKIGKAANAYLGIEDKLPVNVGPITAKAENKIHDFDSPRRQPSHNNNKVKLKTINSSKAIL